MPTAHHDTASAPASDWLTSAEVERFRAKFEVQGECWIWQGPPDKDGYGTFYLRKRGRRAHRVAWYWQNGPIPDGLVIDHSCRHRSCVNPDHLNLATPSENVFANSHSVPALNRLKTECKNGHPFDREYSAKGGHTVRYCSICEAAKRKRLRASWEAEARATKC